MEVQEGWPPQATWAYACSHHRRSNEPNLEKTSEVEVRFIPEGPERTTVELEHRNLDRQSAGWESERDGVCGPGGWPLYIQRFVEVLAKKG